MKTKQPKEEADKTTDEDIVEPKTRARKKASDHEEDKSKTNQDDPKPSKEPKKSVPKPKAVVKKRPIGIRKTKTLKAKKGIAARKNAIKQIRTRGRKAVIKPSLESQEKETIPLIPASEIKKEPVEDITPNSRSSSPRTTGRRSRLSSDMIMMKSVLADTPNNLVIGSRTSPYSMRSERSNSPSLFDAKNLRSGKPRKVKNNLLNEVVIKEQIKRKLISDSKVEGSESPEEVKKLKRGRSCSRDGSEISKCSDVTESDISLGETLNDTENKELNKNVDNLKTDIDLETGTYVQVSPNANVPYINTDSALSQYKPDTSSTIKEKDKKNLSLKNTLDSENNNSNRLKLENFNMSELESKYILKTDNDALFEARSSILTSMSKTFNSKQVSKNIRKARRGKKAAAATRITSNQPAKNGMSTTISNELVEEKPETLDSLSKEISDLINDLDQNIDRDQEISKNTTLPADQTQTKTVNQFYGLSKPLGDNNSIATPETPVKEKDKLLTISSESTPSKNDDSENIRLHYEEDSAEKCYENRQEITCTAASIDKLMDRLKEFEEFDKRRQRQESETRSHENKSVMVTNDVVLIHKSGADIKSFKDIQSVRSPERIIEKENVLSCFENNSAISIVKRDQMRRSIDLDLPNSVTLIKRNSVSARKESTSSNHSKESDAISIFEKSLGKDVTLTEIKKTVDRSATPAPQVDLHQFATLHPTNNSQSLAGVVLDSNEISITPRNVDSKLNCNDVQITKRKSSLTLTQKSSDVTLETDSKLATLEKIKSPPHKITITGITVTAAPVAVKSPETMQPVEIEALPPPMETNKPIQEDTSLTSELPKLVSQLPTISKDETKLEEIIDDKSLIEKPEADVVVENSSAILTVPTTHSVPELDVPMESEVIEKKDVENSSLVETEKDNKSTDVVANVADEITSAKSPCNSNESEPGPSNILQETPESQKRKENILKCLGLVTHEAANEERIEKQKEKKRLYGSNYSNIMGKGKSGKSDYTGTLKTVIKLSRGSGDKDKKKYTSSLKMTFQKSKNRSGKPPQDVSLLSGVEDAYYTIERREGGPSTSTEGAHRKSHYSNRLNNHDAEAAPEPEPKETLNLVIPEKASSFSIHPGRLCMDQCFYCGGKFGLFDTPCHIAQMKSSERQRKVLDNEEKLTIDSCLCDACYRHVDRRANCPSYRKRPIGKPPHISELTKPPTTVEKPPSPMDSEEEVTDGRRAICHTSGCGAQADHSIRRKWLIKMRANVNEILQLKGDYPGLHTIPLCGEHYRALAPLKACALCRRHITKHHNLYALHQKDGELNTLLQGAHIPAQLSERPMVCKVCRCFCMLLQRPSDKHMRTYHRKLLQVYNVEIPPELEQATEDMTAAKDRNNTGNKQKKKARNKSKQRKSTDNSESSVKSHSESEKEKSKDDIERQDMSDINMSNTSMGEMRSMIEEDIESLISSNKIPVPGAMSQENNSQSDSSEDMISDQETPLLPLDKQTELRYLLQKQNNPAQFQQTGNLTQKQKNILKVQTFGIQKPGHQHRIHEKNSKRVHKLGQILVHKDKGNKKDENIQDRDRQREINVIKNISLNEECTIETIPNKKPADINTLKNKWQMSESFTQVKKNLTEMSKKLTVEKEPKKSNEAKYSNPVKRLETNPSISVRELFPGEEEMNLQCNIDFNTVKGITPEGWEKCNSLIQYDVETKKLWTELQRPYGNQSSFLRHLILLEKYFRSGDLVLSHNASPHAANYSSSVQSRLRAYDNIPSETPKKDSVSLIEFRKKPSVNGKSLLKSNQTAQDPKKFMPPPGSLPKPKSKTDKKNKPLPPELIAINTPNAHDRKAMQNVLQNIQKLVKDVTASDPTVIAAAPLPPKYDTSKDKAEMPGLKFDLPKEIKEMPGLRLDTSKEKNTITSRQETTKTEKTKNSTPKKQKSSMKGWRPTLMPITPENLAKIAREPLMMSVDGHSLPSLVQVVSSGTRYHITFEDYNKMCLIRKERQKRLEEKEAKLKKSKIDDTTVVTEIQTSTMLGNGGTVVQNIPSSKDSMQKDSTDLQMTSNAATILKNVGLKNITIAPIPPKTATVTSQTLSPAVSSPSLLVTTPIKIPQLGPAVSITSETVITPNLPITSPSQMILPKIPKSLTVIPQSAVANQGLVMPIATTAPSQAVVTERP